MKIYFSHLLNGVICYLNFFNINILRIYYSNSKKVNLRYQNSLKDDTDLRITIKLANFLFLTVSFSLMETFFFIFYLKKLYLTKG